jgi:formylglycine-generating enzyme required for sulfatase activity
MSERATDAGAIGDATAPDRQPEAPPGMAWIDGGRFRMGSDVHYPEEAPARPVSVDGFWIDTSTSHVGFRCVVRPQVN